jgi:hypothetical protein
MQIVRLFIIAAIVAFVPVLAFPVTVESQELLAREPSAIGDWFNGLGSKIKDAFNNLGKKIRSIGKPKSKKKSKESKPTSTPTPTPSPAPAPAPTSTPPVTTVETRELGAVYAREDDDGLYLRELDDEIYARELDDDIEAREFDDEFEVRGFSEEFDAREPTPSSAVEQHPRELGYDELD